MVSSNEPDNPYKIIDFTEDNFERVIGESIPSWGGIGAAKVRAPYFCEYLGNRLGAQTIVTETNYVDHDFLVDYSAYYVTCFDDYEKRCTRLHFFTKRFTDDDFQVFLTSLPELPTQEEIKASLGDYLGFLVVRPLPETMIGRTCLKPPSEDNSNCLMIWRTYDVNLFGLPLKIRTLAFQEQDRTVAACATSALWATFHKTGKIFQHPFLSAVEITRTATGYAPHLSRTLSLPGLSIDQIARAIGALGMVPFTRDFARDPNSKDEHHNFEGDELKATIYAYVRGYLPALLSLKLIEKSGAVAYHMVTITGFELHEHPAQQKHNEKNEKDRTDAPPKDAIRLKSSRITKIYVHDDLVGPYAPLEFTKNWIPIEKRNGPNILVPEMSSKWLTRDICGQYERIAARHIVIPLYQKMRIPYGVPYRATAAFQKVLSRFMTYGEQKGMNKQELEVLDLEWEIYLTTVNEFKKDMLASDHAKGITSRMDLLTKRMPRFIWRSIGRFGGLPMIELVFDATDLEQGALFVGAVKYNAAFSLLLDEVCKVLALQSEAAGSLYTYLKSILNEQQAGEALSPEIRTQVRYLARILERLMEPLLKMTYSFQGSNYSEEKKIAPAAIKRSDLLPDDLEGDATFMGKDEG